MPRFQTTYIVYQFLWNYHKEHGFMPAQQEIADACYIAISGVSRHLDRLTIWGWIDREEGKARSYRLLVKPEEARIPKRRRKK